MRLLILGAGAVVTEFYLPALAWLGPSWRTTLVDKSEQALARAQSLAPWIQTSSKDFREVLSQEKGSFDAVVVALPNWLHVDACRTAIAAGLPILCEKPLALTADECLALNDLATKAAVPLEVAMVRRLTPANQAAASVINSGVLGQLQKIEVDHGAPYGWLSNSGAFFTKSNGGILADLGVHHLDWISSMLGPLSPVDYEDDARGGIEASCEYQLATNSGVPVILRCTYRRLLSNMTRFVGANATLVVDRSNFEYCQLNGLINGASTKVFATRPFDDDSLPHSFESCFIQQLVDFASVVNNGRPVRVSAQSAAATIGLIEHAYKVRDQRLTTAKGNNSSDNRPKLPTGRAVVTGATGFIGGHLLERLGELGFDDLVVPVRNFKTCANAARFSAELRKTDLQDRTQVRELVKGARWLFHLAYGLNEKDATGITIDATKILVEEGIKAGVEAIVVLSTMGVFGHPSTNTVVDESFGYDPAYGSYGKTKATMEQWLLNPGIDCRSTRIVVLNPSCVYGPDGKTYTRLPYELAVEDRFAWVEGGQGIANFVYVENLVDAILHVASQPQLHRQRFIVNDGVCTWREFLTPLLGEKASGIPNLRLDQFVEPTAPPVKRATAKEIARFLMRDYGFVELVNRHPVLGRMKSASLKLARQRLETFRQPVLEQRTVNAQASTHHPPPWLVELFGPTTARFSSAKLQATGWTPQVPLAEGMQRTTDWLRWSGIW